MRAARPGAPRRVAWRRKGPGGPTGLQNRPGGHCVRRKVRLLPPSAIQTVPASACRRRTSADSLRVKACSETLVAAVIASHHANREPSWARLGTAGAGGDSAVAGSRRRKWMDCYKGCGRNARLTCRHFDISPQNSIVGCYATMPKTWPALRAARAGRTGCVSRAGADGARLAPSVSALGQGPVRAIAPWLTPKVSPVY
jgi:hypothetical protein